MDAAQMITSAVMPGAGALPTSSESAVGGSASSQLFSQMFAKAALTVEIPGKPAGRVSVTGQSLDQQSVNSKISATDSLLTKEKGTVLSAEMLAISGGRANPERGEPDLTVFQEGKIGNLLAQAMVLRQAPKEVSLTPDQRGLSLHKGHASKGAAKADIAEGQPEVELQPGSEELPAKDVSSQKTPVEESETDISRLEIPQLKSADTAGAAILAALPTELVGAMVATTAVQNIPHVFTARLAEAATQPVFSDVVSVAEQAGTEAVRETLLAVKDDGMARIDPRTLANEGKADQLLKNAGFVSGQMAETEVSFVQPEGKGLNAVQGNRESNFSAGAEFASVISAESGQLKTADLSAKVTSPDPKETAKVIPGDGKLFGKGHGNAVHHENGSAIKQPQQDVKVDGKGETVLRELPSGVTVLNPSQTVTMGRPEVSVEVTLLTGQASDRGRATRPEGENQDERGREVFVSGESEKTVLKKEGSSSQDNSNLGQNAETIVGNNGLSQKAVSNGSFDTVIKGQMEPLSEVPREHEVSALHENILSQVREKLGNQDPSGNVSKITLKLNPHELGELQINVRLEDNKMKVDITAQNSVVKDALLQNLDQLKDTLLRQNISMERFNVSTGNGGGQAFNQSFREGRQSAHQMPDTYSFPMSGYYQEDPQMSRVAFGDSKENSLVDMRF